MLENAPFRGRKLKKNILGRGQSQTPALLGRGHPLPKLHPLGVCGASTLAPSALDMCSPFENPGSASGL